MAVSSGPVVATPTDITRVFTTSGIFTPAFTGTVEVLVVGGGGAGGGGIGGGGGGGGVVYMPAVSVTSGTQYTITVGAGGAAVLYSGISGSGGDSTAFGATAKGGGGSGVHDSGDGVAGGSGGGAASNNSRLNTGGASSGNSLGSNTGVIYGNRGGNMTAARTGGPTAAAGGGGAGAAAADTNSNTVQTTPGNANGRGGAGIDSSILGTLYYWAGGGGGGAYFNGYAGDGGIGGGGGGSCSNGLGPTNGGGVALNSGTGAATNTNGGAGGQNTGGGGGGGAWQVTFGGAGGSGIVIIRYSSSLGTSTGGSSISLGDMVMCLDAGNPQSNIGNRSIINWNDWTVGTGGVTGYAQNGDGNSRLEDTNPWGANAIVWQSLNNDVSSDADGGWNTSYFDIDNTKTYRFSTWVKRKVLGNGSFYLGTGGITSGNANVGVLNRSNGAVNTNPYFTAFGWNLSIDVWYLVVGHIWPAGSGTGAIHQDTGIYTVNGKVSNIADFVWQDTNAKSYHRSYLYYSTDPTTQQQWYQPRVDLCDGTEPSIQELLQNAGNTLYDVSGNNNNATLVNGVGYNSSNLGSLVFDGANDYLTIPNNASIRPASELTIEMVIYPTATPASWGQLIGYGQANYANGNYLLFLETASTTCRALARVNNTEYRCNTSFTAPLNQYTVVTFTMKCGDAIRSYFNGVADVTAALPSGTFTYNATALPYQVASPGGSWFSGRIPLIRMYNRALTASEVQQNFNAIRGRYGI